VCWEYNLNGQLGLGNTQNQTSPKDVQSISLLSGVAAISAGTAHTCAISAAGEAHCWGLNTNGRLGNGDQIQQSIPVKVAATMGSVVSISAGDAHSCAVTAAGVAMCWGLNTTGRLGDGTATQRLTPVEVHVTSTEIVDNAQAIAAGFGHSCALLKTGRVMCWGRAELGQLGNGTMPAESRLAVEVNGLTDAIAIAAGAHHTCVVTRGGVVKCWGYNNYGQLGAAANDKTNRAIPWEVSGLTDAVAVTAGTNHTCAYTSDGTSKCWGYNQYGKLGDNTIVDKQVPAQVWNTPTGTTAIAAGTNHTCAIVSGIARCWGYNGYGNLGTNTTGSGNVTQPQTVVGW